MNVKTFSKRMKQLRIEKGLSQVQLGELLGKTHESAQAYVSKLESDKSETKPSFDVLCTLADIFNVSLDWLVGRTEDKQNFSSELSPREICRILSDVLNSNMAFEFKEITTTENCFVLHEQNGNFLYGDAEHRKKQNSYLSIYFPEWYKAECEEEFMEFINWGNYNKEAADVNFFLSRLSKIHRMKLSGDLDDEMYNILLNKYLEDVPDK